MENYPSTNELSHWISNLSPESLIDIRKYIEFLKFRDAKNNKDLIIKLGGLLSNYNIDISDDDISNARNEMWSKFGTRAE